jgi:hypothetical protein
MCIALGASPAFASTQSMVSLLPASLERAAPTPHPARTNGDDTRTRNSPCDETPFHHLLVPLSR